VDQGGAAMCEFLVTWYFGSKVVAFIGLVVNAAGVCLLAWEWRGARREVQFDDAVADRRDEYLQDFDKVAKSVMAERGTLEQWNKLPSEGQKFAMDFARGDFALAMNKLQREERAKSWRRRGRWFSIGLYLVLLGLAYQIVGAWPYC
jgi:hypothetical protein